MKIFWIILTSIFLSPVYASADKHTQQPGLTKQVMQQRSKIISKVKYALDIDLVSSDKKFSGKVNSTFVLSKVPESLRIDFAKGEVHKILANDVLVDDYSYNKHFIKLSGQFLKEGANYIQIEFSHEYSKNANGFYRFNDPKDGHSYVYTHFEPYDANKLFPLFDQPDLRATYQLSVLAPENWTVITSVLEQTVKKTGNNKRWYFAESQPYSTYLFSLSAGPYSVWKSSYEGKNKSIPMRLFSRQSLSEYVNHAEWFTITKQGFKFFEDYFDTAYPFTKYDQVLVPDFNAGAMENVGAVTFNEFYIYKSKPTDNQRERRANTILHELAHMWFGNLVTMKWWNGLWLNESFATIMAYMALFEATEFKHSWQTFYSRAKNWAYWTDQLVTTHPIEVPVNDTTTAFTNFDGITYGKGASVLKQLQFYLGDDFKVGLRRYFKTHAWSNTELEDFFAAMQDASGKDLTLWVDLWIKKAGVNTLAVDYDCKEGVIAKFDLVQKAPEGNLYLRPHRTRIALLSRQSNENRLIVYKSVNVFYEGQKTEVKELVDVACPELVLANFDDQDYVKLQLDTKSLNTVKSAITDIEDILIRAMVWDALWNMVRDGDWPITQYLDLLLANITAEKDTKIQSELLYKLSDDVVFYLKKNKRNKRRNNEKLVLIENFVWEHFNKAKATSDRQKNWYEAYRRSVSSDEGLARLFAILDGKLILSGLKIDQKRRWDILKVLNKFDYPDAWKLVENELSKDQSDYAKKGSIAAEAGRPDRSAKQKWMSHILDFETDMKFSYLKSAMNNIFPVEQSEFQQPYVDSYFDSLSKLSASKDNTFMQSFTGRLAPSFCSKGSVLKIAQFLESHAELPEPVIKTLRIKNQENERCVNITQQIVY